MAGAKESVIDTRTTPAGSSPTHSPMQVLVVEKA
jgi:hypothetical protein